MKKTWALKKSYPHKLAEDINGDGITLQLLFNRGIRNQKEADEFFNPDYVRDSHDPFLLPDMDKAAARILSAIDNNEYILVFGDYDADGVCATTVFADFFSFAGYEKVSFYNPDRYKEGYGVSEKALERIFELKPRLVITVDAGTSNYDTIKKLQEKGIDVIVIDHHLVESLTHPAFALVNHQRRDNHYPFPFLCGTGLAFKMVQALCKKREWPFKEGYEKWILDLVAIATIADMVPLKNENRMYVYWGLEVIKKNRRLGLRGLMKNAGIAAEDISAEDIAYTLAPLINSAGRLDHANTAVELLRAQSESETAWLSSRLAENNNRRKEMVKDIVSFIENGLSVNAAPEIVVFGDKDWHPGVLGIAAGKIVEKYARPAFIFGKGEGADFKGSARSDGSVNLVELMKLAGADLFSAFGGHAMAAGFTLARGKEKELAIRLGEAYGAMPKNDNLFEDLEIEKEMSIDDINWNTYVILERFEPFGAGNQRPNFLFKNLVVKNFRVFGNGGKHLEFIFQKSNGEFVKAIQFGAAYIPESIRPGARVDLVAFLEHSKFNGNNELRLRMEDYKII